MNFLSDIYQKRLDENERKLNFWSNYLKELQELDLKYYGDKLTVPTLVPIGNHIFFRGEIIHTNELTVSLGADYFVKCSLHQAEILRQHRIKDATAKVEMYEEEQNYLTSQIAFSNENIYGTKAEEIVEAYSEEEDKAWRIKHRQNMRKYKKEEKMLKTINNSIPDEDLWKRLDELELQEELAQELDEMNKPKPTEKSSAKKERPRVRSREARTSKISNTPKELKLPEPNVITKEVQVDKNIKAKIQVPIQNSKMQLLEQVIEKQTRLERQLRELQSRKIIPEGASQKELMAKLDEIQELGEIEDDMNRLDYILLNEKFDFEDEGVEVKLELVVEDDKSEDNNDSKLKKSVSFADKADLETLEIHFKHSNVEPKQEPYCPEKGILKPSDLYEMYPNLIIGATSILKKSKYPKEDKTTTEKSPKPDKKESQSSNEENATSTVSVNDIVEKANNSQDKKKCNSTRPMSLFKKRRMLNKKQT